MGMGGFALTRRVVAFVEFRAADVVRDERDRVAGFLVGLRAVAMPSTVRAVTHTAPD